jgi:ribose/xylose/arabinose/galactoside ABC-type transport system permease subunit
MSSETASPLLPAGSHSGLFGFLKPNEWALVFSILLVIAGTATLDKSHAYVRFPKTAIQDNARRIAPLGILALGAAVVIISGGIDLSVGSVAALSGTICATLLLALGGDRFDTDEGLPASILAIAISVAVASGLVIGTLHTWLITVLRLPPFIVTLGSLVGLRSFARALCWFMTGRFKGSSSEELPFSDPFFRFLNSGDWIWIAVLVMLVIAIKTWVLLNWTVLGRHIYAMGGNEQAARLSGIRTENVKWFVYCFSATCASLAGVFYIAESGAKPSTLAAGYELNAIAAAVVGGCSLQGGVGTVIGTILGVVFLRAVVDSVARIVRGQSDMYEGMIVGMVVVLAVTFSQLRQIQQSGRQMFPGALGWLAIPGLSGAVALVVLVSLGVQAGIWSGMVVFIALLAWKIAEVARFYRAQE